MSKGDKSDRKEARREEGRERGWRGEGKGGKTGSEGRKRGFSFPPRRNVFVDSWRLDARFLSFHFKQERYKKAEVIKNTARKYNEK